MENSQREAAIKRASMFRRGMRTIDKEGHEAQHASISAAKRFTREKAGVGNCVAQTIGEDLFEFRREQIADARAKAAAEEEAKAKETA